MDHFVADITAVHDYYTRACTGIASRTWMSQGEVLTCDICGRVDMRSAKVNIGSVTWMPVCWSCLDYSLTLIPVGYDAIMPSDPSSSTNIVINHRKFQVLINHAIRAIAAIGYVPPGMPNNTSYPRLRCITRLCTEPVGALCADCLCAVELTTQARDRKNTLIHHYVHAQVHDDAARMIISVCAWVCSGL